MSRANSRPAGTGFGDRLRRMLTDRRMKYPDLAEKLGVTKSSVGLWTSNATEPTSKNLLDIILIFPEYNPRWIILGELPEENRNYAGKASLDPVASAKLIKNYEDHIELLKMYIKKLTD